MSLNYQDIEQARVEAENTLRRADEATRQASRLIIGRLRSSNVQGYVLEELKRELKDFNMKTHTWKKRGE